MRKSDEPRRYGRIKPGAVILHDTRAWTWPRSANPLPADPNTVFYIDPLWPKGWKCIADGFGALPENGVKGVYRNGAILLHEDDDIEFITPEPSTKRKTKDA
jgi:hypothetical protein